MTLAVSKHYFLLGDTDVTCDGCGWPMCSNECSDEHKSSTECSLLGAIPAPVFQDSETISEVRV